MSQFGKVTEFGISALVRLLMQWKVHWCMTTIRISRLVSAVVVLFGFSRLFHVSNVQLVNNKLEIEFEVTYPGNVSSFSSCLILAFVNCNSHWILLTFLSWLHANQANPLKLLARAKRLQDELPLLREESDKLLAAKQVIF